MPRASSSGEDRVVGLLEGIESRWPLLAAVLILIGVLGRILLIAATTSPSQPSNLLYPGYGDGIRYVHIAQSLVDTGTFGYAGRPTAFRSPAYPSLLALTWKSLGPTLTPIRILQVVMFGMMAAIYARAVGVRFGGLAGCLAAALLSAHPMLAFLTAEIATESLYMLFESLVFVLTLALAVPGLAPRRQLGLAGAAGLCCGAGALTRPNMFPVFLLIGLFLIAQGIWRRQRWRAWALPVVALTLGNYLVLTPWLIRNQRTIGATTLATNIDYNLFRGTVDLTGRIPAPQVDGAMKEAYRAHQVLYEGDIEDVARSRLPWSEGVNESRARTEAIAAIRADPSAWVRERLLNAAYLWLNLQWEGERLGNPLVLLASLSVSVFYYGLLAAAVFGGVTLGRARCDEAGRRFLQILLLFIAAAMPVVLTIVGKRYRVTMIDPYLVLLASVGAAEALRRLGRAASSASRARAV